MENPNLLALRMNIQRSFGNNKSSRKQEADETLGSFLSSAPGIGVLLFIAVIGGLNAYQKQTYLGVVIVVAIYISLWVLVQLECLADNLLDRYINVKEGVDVVVYLGSIAIGIGVGLVLLETGQTTTEIVGHMIVYLLFCTIPGMALAEAIHLAAHHRDVFKAISFFALFCLWIKTAEALV